MNLIIDKLKQIPPHILIKGGIVIAVIIFLSTDLAYDEDTTTQFIVCILSVTACAYMWGFLPQSFSKVFQARSMSELQTTDPREVELYVVECLKNKGYKRVEATPAIKDGGKDIVAYSCNNKKVYIEVKRHNQSIGVELIRSFYGVMCSDGIKKGVYFATTTYSRGAEEFAKDKPIQLVSINNYDSWVHEKDSFF